MFTEEKRSYRRETCPSAIRRLQLQPRLAWERTRASAMRNRRLNTWAIAGPPEYRISPGPFSSFGG